jgi:hypothetical protein
MTKVSVLSQTGSSVGEIELNDAIFGIEPNEAILFEALVQQRASLRQGNHKVKNRSEVAGVAVELYLVRHQEAIHTNYQEKFAESLFYLHFHQKYAKRT